MPPVKASIDCRLGDTHVTAPAAVGLKRRYLQAVNVVMSVWFSVRELQDTHIIWTMQQDAVLTCEVNGFQVQLEHSPSTCKQAL
jgi:hypothetical protein